MLGRYEIISDTKPSPMPASMNDMTVLDIPNGRSKPRVSSDDPEMMKASDQGRTPIPQNSPVNPVSTNATHIIGRANRAIGEYMARIRSRNSNDWLGLATRSNRRRMLMNVARVRMDEVARGSTTVLIADPIVHTTKATPRTATTTRTTITAATLAHRSPVGPPDPRRRATSAPIDEITAAQNR